MVPAHEQFRNKLNDVKKFASHLLFAGPTWISMWKIWQKSTFNWTSTGPTIKHAWQLLMTGKQCDRMYGSYHFPRPCFGSHVFNCIAKSIKL